MMGKSFLLWIGVLYLALSGGGGCNLFSDIANKTSDPAIVDDVNNLIDRGKWNDAILKWGTLSPAGQAERTNIVLLATAYAGRGGLNVINVANALSGSTDPTFFLMLMHAFKGSTASSFNDEVTAEALMLGISKPASGRTTDENMFMIFLEMAKLGTLFASTADTNSDGTVDAGFDGCVNTTALEAEHVATGVSIMVDSLSSVSNSIVSGAATQITAQCAAGQPLNTAGLCGGLYLPADVNNSTREAAQTLIGETNMSVGLEAAADAANCELQGGAPPCDGNAGSTLCP